MAIIEKQFTTPTRTSRNIDYIATLPKFKEMISISTNTGSATFSLVDGSKDQVKIMCRSGTYYDYYDGTYWVEGDSYTLDVSAGNRVITEYAKYSGGSWSYSHSTYSGASLTYNYRDSQGYYGTLDYRDSGRDTVYFDAPSNPYEGQTYATHTITRYGDVYYGRVQKDGYWAGSYTYYYRYIINIKYKSGGLELKVRIDDQIRNASEGWVKIDGALKEIDTLNIKVDDVIKERV